MVRSALVVGTGRTGASAAPALRGRSIPVHLRNQDPTTALTAEALGAGTPRAPQRPVDLAIVAAPPPSAILVSPGSSAGPAGPCCRRSCPPNSVKATPGYPLPAHALGPCGAPPGRGHRGRSTGEVQEGRPRLLRRSGITASGQAQTFPGRTTGHCRDRARFLSALCRETIHSARRTALAVGA